MKIEGWTREQYVNVIRELGIEFTSLSHVQAEWNSRSIYPPCEYLLNGWDNDVYTTYVDLVIGHFEGMM